MGNTSSKAGRKYLSSPKFPTVSQTTQTGTPAVSRLAKERRTAIEKDAGDPHFLANLSCLGPVRVDHPMRTVRTEANHTTGLFQSRAKAELEASSHQLTRYHLYSSALSELLDKRKSARNREDVSKLCQDFGIEMETLENLARFLNSPSVDKSMMWSSSEKNDEDGMVVPAAWIEPASRT